MNRAYIDPNKAYVDITKAKVIGNNIYGVVYGKGSQIISESSCNKILTKTWDRAKLLAWWHGGKPAQYMPSLMKQGDRFSWWQVDLVPTCVTLLLANLMAVAYILSM